MIAEIATTLSAAGAAVAAVLTGVYVWLTYRILVRQATVAEAEVYVKIRQMWFDLDDLMSREAHLFSDMASIPVGPFVVDDLPNADPRLYIAYRLFGTIETMVLLSQDYKLARTQYVDSVTPTLRAVMSMPVTQEIWRHVESQYPENVQQFVNSFITVRRYAE